MAYEKQTFTAGQTLLASDLNTMSQGIKDVDDGLATKQPVGDYATKAELNAGLSGKQAAGDYATSTQVNAKISASGSRGVLGGYSAPVSTASAVTISDGSNDDTVVTAAVSVTVSNGGATSSWTKTVALQDASATVSLGDSWAWVGGTAPTITANSVVILKWTGSFGLANLIAGE